ncbi:hypothetical protein DPMN_046003 [Dreissena polymorpha]|uniref:Uncharacterized protein n=1 Tax=Dreissena polymorpha TaxID=45954 RepID=A0A9D4D554_DREPO|nr:hypothetical protein DPMN_046003 [Dreissena polymorpha]
MANEIIRTIDANKVRHGQEYFTNAMFKEATNYADRYIEETYQAKPRESNTENDIVEMRSKTISDKNKPETYKNNVVISKRKERVSQLRERFETVENKHELSKRKCVERQSVLDLKKQFDPALIETKSSRIQIAHAHQFANITQQEHVKGYAVDLAAQNNRASEQMHVSGNKTKPALLNNFKPEFIQNLNKKLQDGAQRSNVERQSTKASDIGTEELEDNGHAHQFANATQQEHVEKFAFRTVAQNESALQQMHISGYTTKPSLENYCSGGFH